MKLGQALSMLVYTSMTVKRLTSDGVEAVTEGQYRAVAAAAAVTCLIGAVLFFLYREKEVLGTIRSLRSRSASSGDGTAQ